MTTENTPAVQNGLSRLGRKHYFWGQLLIVAISAPIFILLVISNLLVLIWIFSIVYLLIAFPITIGMGIRRLHDIGLSGWWLLLWFVPIAGAILGLLLLFARGDHSRDNDYGPSPAGSKFSISNTYFGMGRD